MKLTDNVPEAGKLLLPSWLSIIASILIGIGFVSLIAIAANYESSSLYILVESKQSDDMSISENYETVGNELSASSLLNNASLLIFWAAVGTGVYFIAITFFRWLAHIYELRKEMDYVNANPQLLVKESAQHLLIRGSALIAWWLFMQFSRTILLPYFVAVAYAGGSSDTILGNIGYVVLCFVGVVVALHIHVVLLRLLFLRPRLFTH